MKKTLTIAKNLVIMSLFMTIATQYNTMTTQANQRYSVEKVMNESEKRVIADIKKACTLLSSESATLASVASEFGTPKEEIPNASILEQKAIGFQHEQYGVQPYNHDLEAVGIGGNASVSFYIKPGKYVYIDSLEEEFGKYTISDIPLEVAMFSYMVPGVNQRPYRISVLYYGDRNYDKNDPMLRSAQLITISQE